MVEFGNAVALRVVDRVHEDGGANLATNRFPKTILQAVAKEQIVAQHECTALVCDEPLSDEKSLGKPTRLGLLGVVQSNAPARTVAEQMLKQRGIAGRGDDQD